MSVSLFFGWNSGVGQWSVRRHINDIIVIDDCRSCNNMHLRLDRLIGKSQAFISESVHMRNYIFQIYL